MGKKPSEMSAATVASFKTKLTIADLCTETVLYYNNIKAQNSDIPLSHLIYIDNFIKIGKRDGWFSKLVCFCPFLGNNLVAAKVKLVADISGKSSVDTYNIVETDYDPIFGISVEGSNSNKYIGIGLIPSSNGLSNTNAMFARIQTKRVPEVSSGRLINTNPTSGDNGIYCTTNGYFGISTLTFPGFSPIVSQVLNINGSNAQSFRNGISEYDNTSQSAPAAFTDSETTIFKSIRDTNTYYQTGNVAGVAFGKDFTKANTISFQLAFYELYINLGRIKRTGSLITFLGDSITAGQGATYGASTRFPLLVAENANAIEHNVGIPDSNLTANVNGIVGGYTKYSEILKIGSNCVIIMYGTNDAAYDGQANGNATTAADYTVKLSEIIQVFKDNGMNVIICGISWRAEFNAAKLTMYTEAAYSSANTKNVRFVDLYNTFLDAVDPSAYFADGTHPNDLGHRFIAERIIAAMDGKIYRDKTFDFGSINAASSADLTLTMYGAKAGMTVTVGEPTAPTSGIIYKAFVSADNTVTVRATNITAAPIDPVSCVMRITVFIP